jgi:hypothetical protein
MNVVVRDDSDVAQAARLADLTGQARLDRHARVAKQLRKIRAVGSP